MCCGIPSIKGCTEKGRTELRNVMTHGGANVAEYCETYQDTGVALIFVLRRFAAVTVSLLLSER